MPIYTYRCKKCNFKFDSIRSWQQRESPNPCPKCNGETAPQISAPALGNMDKFGRTK